MIKAVLALLLYVAIVGIFVVTVCTAPALAFQATNYSRVITAAQETAYVVTQKPAMAASIAAAAVQSTPPSTLLKIVASSNWVGLAVTVGITLFSLYYTAQQLTALKNAAATPGGYNGTNPTKHYTEGVIGTNGTCTITHAGVGAGTRSCVAGYDQIALLATGTGCFTGWGNTADWEAYGTTGSGSDVACWVAHVNGHGNGLAAGNPQAATQAQIQSYVQTLPANDANSLESHTSPNGLNHSGPSSADNTVTTVVDPAVTGSSVVQNPVSSGDVQVATNVPPPQGTQQSTGPVTQTDTNTATVTGNQTTNSDVATVSCAVADHEVRTMASVLTAHQTTWNTSGLLGAGL